MYQGVSGRLPQCGCSQGGFVRAAGGAAVGQFAVDDHSGDAVDAEALCASSHSRVLHIEHFDVTRRTGDALHELHGVIAQAAAGTEDFNFVDRGKEGRVCSLVS